VARLHTSYASAHPAAQGHFPGNPIIPGALLLSDAVHTIAQALDADLSSCRVAAAKFLSFVRPGEVMAIDYTGDLEHGAEFVCSIEGRTVLTGSVQWSRTTRP